MFKKKDQGEVIRLRHFTRAKGSYSLSLAVSLLHRIGKDGFAEVATENKKVNGFQVNEAFKQLGEHHMDCNTDTDTDTDTTKVNRGFEKSSQTLNISRHNPCLTPVKEYLSNFRLSPEKWPIRTGKLNELQVNEAFKPPNKSYQDCITDTAKVHKSKEPDDAESLGIKWRNGKPKSTSHAADERIRLEELRQKILSGDGKTIAYLDLGQKLVLPEMGYQLLQSYANQIQNWGWICNIHSQGSRSFTKNLDLLQRRDSAAILLAVPCILGVKLSEIDLLEFLEQLGATDGSSNMPPAVIRVLNSKACRGAIMFGDALLPSECSLIIEELKQTSLCFQCAHGRPTTVALVNLTALHKQIANMGSWNGSIDEPWHGLHRHVPSLKRARQRLVSRG